MTDLAIYSHEEGIRKPDPRFFALASERLGIAPVEIVYLDDRQDYVDAARACGFQAVLFTSTPQAIADIEEETAPKRAVRWRRASPDPGLGVVIELGRGDARGGGGDVVGVG